MKKNLIKTLLIGAAIGTTLTGLASNHADACRLTRFVTIANTTSQERVELHMKNGHFYKKYKSLNYCYNFYDYHELGCDNGPLKLYCTDAYGKPVTGFLRNGTDCYYFENGEAISGNRRVDGHVYSFDRNDYKGHIVG